MLNYGIEHNTGKSIFDARRCSIFHPFFKVFCWKISPPLPVLSWHHVHVPVDLEAFSIAFSPDTI